MLRSRKACRPLVSRRSPLSRNGDRKKGRVYYNILTFKYKHKPRISPGYFPYLLNQSRLLSCCSSSTTVSTWAVRGKRSTLWALRA